MSGDQVSVVGGADGTAAHFEDLQGVAALFDQAAANLDDALDYLRSFMLRWAIASAGGGNSAETWALQSAVDELTSPFGPPALVSARLHRSASALRWAICLYHHADHSVWHSLFGALGALPGAVFDGATTLVRTTSPSAAGQAVLTADPELVDTAARYSLAGMVEDLAGASYPDGHAVLHDLGPDDRAEANTPPRTLAGLTTELALRNEGAAGEISITFVLGGDGRRRAIVNIPGTKSWSPGKTSDVTSLSTNARALIGAPTAYEQGVFEAMSAAGVQPGEEVMLVGHSEGGMVAVEAARDAVRTGQFRVTHVLTAGSPIGRIVGQVSDTVRVLALENRGDLVPHADGRANPDTRNITTVTVRHDDGRISDEHDLATSYVQGAHDADVSTSASIRDFTGSARGFLDGSTEQTHAYLIGRAY